MLTKTQKTVSGPAGNIELNLDLPDQPSNIAVLCHPHPLYGGSMHDGVLQIAADTLLHHNLGVVRFNFRGVGASQCGPTECTVAVTVTVTSAAVCAVAGRDYPSGFSSF